MSAPAVSVVIPAYNAAAFIARTLDSVRAQTYRDFEVVVVDDGSADATHDAVTAYLSTHGLVGNCIKQANKRIAGARNTGLRAARGAYVALLDHDDSWKPDKLEKTMAEARRHPDAVLIGHHITVVDEAGRRLRLLRKGPASPRMYERLLLGGNAVSPSAAVFKTSEALAIGGFREEPQFNTVEDYDFWMRLSQRGPFVFLDEALADYTVVEGSASRRIEYHHQNLEALLRDHFARHFGPAPGLAARWAMRRRLAAASRSTLAELLRSGQDPALARRYALSMLRQDPFAFKNLGRAAQWLLGLRQMS